MINFYPNKFNQQQYVNNNNNWWCLLSRHKIASAASKSNKNEWQMIWIISLVFDDTVCISHCNIVIPKICFILHFIDRFRRFVARSNLIFSLIEPFLSLFLFVRMKDISQVNLWIPSGDNNNNKRTKRIMQIVCIA